MSQDNFVRIPPDSTGKKIRHSVAVDIYLTNINVLVLETLTLGDTITDGSGQVELLFKTFSISNNDVIINANFTLGNSLQVNSDIFFNGDRIGEVEKFNSLHTPTMVVSDSDKPTNTMRVDDNGSAYVRFNDGDLSLDAFGNANFSQTTIMKSHMFQYGSKPGDFEDITDVGGSIVDDVSKSVIRLQTNTNINSRATRYSTTFLPYNPQEANFVCLAVGVGDQGKEGVVRRWGLFDGDDGLYFELDGVDLHFVIKSSVDGTETKIANNEFNGNRLLSDTFDIFKLDVSKMNLYWIDYQWQGVGAVRFGVYSPDGTRILMHTIRNSNRNNLPYIKSGVLNMALEQINTSNVVSPSEMRSSCMVATRNSDRINFIGNTYSYNTNDFIEINSTDPTPLLSIRLKNDIDGVPNRVMILPTIFEVIVQDNPVILEYYLNGTLVNPDFQTFTNATEIDESADDITGGFKIDQNIFSTGFRVVEIDDSFGFSLSNPPSNTYQNVVTITARCINSSLNSKVYFVGKWKEIC